MTEPQFFRIACWVLFIVSGAIFFILGRVSAPYGRHSREGWGPTMPRRLGWVVMEAPSIFFFAALFFMGPRSDLWVPRILGLLWMAHYFHRGLIYPVVNHRPGQRIPLSVVGFALTFNFLNSYINARSLTAFGPEYELDWLLSFRFLYGLLLFIAGYVINRWSDIALTRLRRQGEGYQIPRGGLFEEVSCPNYLGEVVQWAGWAFMTWSSAGLAFAAFTFANLVPRAVSHHNWYRRKFPAYPRRRRAIIPYVL